MTIRLHSLISILLTTMLVFNYAIGNIVYATSSADGANQSSTQNQEQQEQTTTEEEEQSTENLQENENSVVEEPQEEQSTEEQQTSPTEEEQATTEQQQASPTEEDQATAEEQQTSPTEEEQATTEQQQASPTEEDQATVQEEENNEAEEQTTEESQESTTETTEEESTEGENAEQQESTDTDENSNTSISAQSSISPQNTTELESVLRNASGTTSNEVVANSSYIFINSLNGPVLDGGLTEEDQDDVVRVFTFFDKSKINFTELFRHDGQGNGTTRRPLTVGAIEVSANDIYADEVRTYTIENDLVDTRFARPYGTSGDNVYNGHPFYYIYSTNITTEPPSGKINPCKDVYDAAKTANGSDSTVFTTLAATDAVDIGCIGFERFRGYKADPNLSINQELGLNYKFNTGNSDVYGFRLKIKNNAVNGDTDLISVATSAGYKIENTADTAPTIKETVKTLTVVDPALKVKTMYILNSTETGEEGPFDVGVEFLANVDGFVQDADFRFVENGTDTEVGTVTRIRKLYPYYLYHGDDDPTDTDYGDDQYDYLNENFFVVTVVPDGGYEIEFRR